MQRPRFEKIKAAWQRLAPYHDVIIFMVTLLLADGVWKLLIRGAEEVNYVTLCGWWEITPPFAAVSDHIARVVYAIVHVFRDQVVLTDEHILRFSTGHATSIVWGCSGIKQSFIWIALMATSRGAWRKKWWWILVGLAAAYLFNIFRITMISFAVENHPEWFAFLHGCLFKYLYYGMLFLLWAKWISMADTTKCGAGNDSATCSSAN